MILIMSENTNTNIRIVDNMFDGNSYECYGTLFAYIDNDIVGTLEYSLIYIDNEFYIRMISVDPKYRRMGIATALCNYIKNNYNDYYVEWGYTTNEGSLLKDKLTKTIPNKQYQSLQDKIDKIQNRLDELELQTEKAVSDFDNASNDIEKEKIQKSICIIGDEWNSLYDKQCEYISDRDELRPYITVWI